MYNDKYLVELEKELNRLAKGLNYSTRSFARAIKSLFLNFDAFLVHLANAVLTTPTLYRHHSPHHRPEELNNSEEYVKSRNSHPPNLY
jgi:hypothetical protein